MDLESSSSCIARLVDSRHYSTLRLFYFLLFSIHSLCWMQAENFEYNVWTLKEVIDWKTITCKVGI